MILQRSKLHSINNDLATFIQNKKIIDFGSDWADEKQYLIEHEIIFKLNSPSEAEMFPNLDFDFVEPNFISNAVIHSQSIEKSYVAIDLLADLGMRYLLLVVKTTTTLEVQRLIETYQRGNVYQIFLHIIEPIDLFQDNFMDRLKNQKLLNLIGIARKDINTNGSIDSILKKHLFHADQSFRVNIKLFSENLNYNSYYNGKIFIDRDGNIKNGSLTNRIFGNINQVESKEQLMQILTETDFMDLWKVKKDDCAICKDCELRYMCIDNREPIKLTTGEYYHTEECNYNPYTGKWT